MSPIEAQFLVAIGRCWLAQGDERHEGPREGFRVIHSKHGLVFAVIPQAEVGPYRADFGLMIMRGDHQKMIAVELDGHDFHEKTKEQVARDKKRDRYFASLGLTVLRFSGSEVHRDVDACVKESIDVLTQQPLRLGVD